MLETKIMIVEEEMEDGVQLLSCVMQETATWQLTVQVGW